MTSFQTIIDQAKKSGNFSFFILTVNILQFFVAVAALIIAILALTR
jgi:hypothetical protein